MTVALAIILGWLVITAGVGVLAGLHRKFGLEEFMVGGRSFGTVLFYTIAAFFFLYIGLLVLISIVVASGGNNILTSFSAAAVTLGNIGPGFGKVGPSGNYAQFPAYVKWVLSFAMLAGRLELYTVLVLLRPKMWIR